MSEETQEATVELEKELEAEINKFIKEGPTEDELKRVKASYFANFIKAQFMIKFS